jgi:membrane protein implicated in regulation of membrane protease activity
MFLLLALPLLILLPWPWNLVGGLASGALGVAEFGYWHRRMRRREVATGVEDLVGASAQVTESCTPIGRVRLKGELWEARSKQQIARGTSVRVVAVDGLVLEVEPMSLGSRNSNKDLGALAAILVMVLALAGCGGGDDEDSAESWANDVCSSLSTWITDIDEAVEPLRDAGLSLDEDDVQTAVDRLADATSTLADDLEELEPPETEDSEQARTQLEGLAATLRSEVDTVRQTVESDSGAVTVSSTVSTSLSTAAGEVQSTFNDLQGLDPGGELEDGFENADECDSLREQIDDIGS